MANMEIVSRVLILTVLVESSSITTKNNGELIEANRVDISGNKTADDFMRELHDSCLGFNPETKPEYILKYSKQFANVIKTYKEALDMKKQIAKQVQELFDSTSDSYEHEHTFNAMLSALKEMCMARDCSEVHRRTTGLHNINANNMKPVQVMCNMNVDGGNWTVIQQRQDGSVDFRRTWQDYKNGFGNLEGEFWLGNEIIHHFTTSGRYELRFDLTDLEGNTWYAVYKTFKVSDEYSKYRLTIGQYSGTADDAMKYHNGMEFSSKDKDNDQSSSHCSERYHGGWWYSSCHLSNLNGLYKQGSTEERVSWYHVKKEKHYSLKYSRMMMRQY